MSRSPFFPSFPDDERDFEAFQQVQSNTQLLFSLLDEFDAAHNLMMFGANLAKPVSISSMELDGDDFGLNWALNRERNRSKTFKKWPIIAARSALICAQSFYVVQGQIGRIIGISETLRQRLDRNLKKEADTLFRKTFPDIAPTRNSAAHPGEFSRTPKLFEKHSLTNEFPEKAIEHNRVTSIYIESSLQISFPKFVYQGTLNGSTHSVEISPRTVWALTKCAHKYAAMLGMEQMS